MTLIHPIRPFIRSFIHPKEAESISYGVSDKATQSEARTRSLYDEAVAAADTLRADLEPRIESAKNDVKQGCNSTDS